MEGGIGFGLGAILAEELTLTGGEVDQANYDTYTPLRIDGMPEIEVHIVPSKERPTGVGEPGVPPIGPAVANAIYAATGKRGPGAADRQGDAGLIHRGSVPTGRAITPGPAAASAAGPGRRLPGPQARAAELAGLLEDRVGDGGQMRVDPLQVAQHVEMQRARLDRLGQPVAQPAEVPLAGLASSARSRSFSATRSRATAASRGDEDRQRPAHLLGDQRVEGADVRPAVGGEAAGPASASSPPAAAVPCR